MSANNIESIYRLAPIQEGILFHTLRAPGTGVYFEQYQCDYRHPVDAEKLRDAWNTVVARHDALRSLITWEKRDKPLQIVRERVELPFACLDWRQPDGPDRVAAQASDWAALLAGDRARGFDLGTAPLMRVHLVRLGDSHYRLLWSYHHAVLDGWSMRLVLREVAQVYGGDAAALPPAPRFGDYIAWREHVDEDRALAFFSNSLAGFESPTCPDASRLERDRGEALPYAATVETAVPAALTARLADFARRERLTLNTLVAAAWGLLLQRYTQLDDVVFGVTVAGRPPDFEGAERVVGLFINTLPLRLLIDEQRPLDAWLQDVQAATQALQPFEQTPLSSVQRRCAPRPDVPLFETIVVFENFPAEDAGAAPALVPESETFAEYSHYPFALLAVPGETLQLIGVYRTDRFGAVAAARILDHLTVLLEAFAAGPQIPVGEVPMMPGTLRDPRNQYDPGVRAEAGRGSDTVHALVEAQAQRTPDHVALSTGDETLTYDELARQSGNVAAALRARGVGPGSLVPVYADRSIAAIVAMLGVLKSGAGYVPIDASYPRARSQFVLADLHEAQRAAGKPEPLAMLCGPGHADALAGTGCDTLPIASLAATTHDGASAPIPVSGEDLAYVMYTSGSTGQPKGVMVTHANLLNSTLARLEYYPAEAPDFLLLSSISTDSSVAGIYWALTTGGRLCLPPPRFEQDTARIAQFVAAERISHVLCVPSLYALLVEYGQPAELESLRIAIVAGEACPPELVRNHYHALPRVALYNEYGPTEATVWATVAALEPRHGEYGVPIGHPVANLNAYVLDPQQRPLADGVPGELYLGGAGIARGYLNQPDSTNAKFCEDPFAGGCMYATGDRARRLADGSLEYLGRVDDQIQVRGYRVEPGEIESVVASHPDVREAAVAPETRRAIGPDETSLNGALQALPPGDAERLVAWVEALSDDAVATALATTETSA